MLEREVNVAGPDELGTDFVLERKQHLLVPSSRKTPPRAVIGDAKRWIGDRVDLPDLRGQPPPALVQIGFRLGVSEIDLAHDRKHRHLEQNRMQPRPLDPDVDLAGGGRRRFDRDEALVEPIQAEQVDEVAFEESP